MLALWWHDTPAVTGFGDWLTNAGRITGLLAGYAVVVLVALMARVPALERGVGTDRLARWHAMGGRYTVGLVVAHAPADHLGVRGHRAHRRGPPDRDAAAELSGRADGDRRRPAPRRRRRRLRPRRPPPDALRDLVLPAPLHLSGDRAGVQPPVRHRRGLHERPAGPGRLVRAVRRRRRPAGLVPVRHAGAGRRSGTGCGSSRSCPGGARRRLGRGRAAGTWTSCGAEAGQFFRWRFLDPRPVVGLQPVLAVGAATPDLLRITVKDLGEHSARAGPAAARHPGRRRGPVRGVHRRSPAAGARCC